MEQIMDDLAEATKPEDTLEPDLVDDGEPDVAGDVDEEDAPPEGTDWEKLGPKLWQALKNLLSGNKTQHEKGYTIEASHEAVGDAHDALQQ
jgi:hypothetical protein